MKLYYIANARIPTEKAHGLQISKMCEAYSENGWDVELIVPDKKNHIEENVFSFYGVKNLFKINYLKIPRYDVTPAHIAYYLEEVFFLIKILFFLKKQKEDFSVVTRDIFVSLFFGKSNNIFYEMHDFPERHDWLWKKSLKKAKGVIVTNSWKKTEIINRFGVSDSRVIISPNGFDAKLFSPGVSEIERGKIGIDSRKKVLCYSGMLKTMGEDKGVGFLIESMSLVPTDVVLLLVGGSESDINEFSKVAERNGVTDRVFFVGRVSYKDLPQYLSIADAFVAPFPDTDHYRYYMSPIKIFEYMAMGKPVIASDLPSIREVLTDYGFYFSPEDKTEFISILSGVLLGDLVSNNYSSDMLKLSEKYTWDIRAKSILSFISSIVNIK